MNAYEIYADRQLYKLVDSELGAESNFAGETGESEFGSLDLGPLGAIVWSGDVTDYLESTNKQIMALDRDIIVSNQVPHDFLTSWEGFKTEWSGYYRAEKDTGHALGASKTMGEIDLYVERLKGYQTKLGSFGVNVPTIVSDVHSTYNPNASLFGAWTTSQKAAAGVGAALVLVLALRR